MYRLLSQYQEDQIPYIERKNLVSTMNQYLTINQYLKVKENEEYKMLKCFGGGQFIRRLGNLSGSQNSQNFHRQLQIHQDCTLAICSSMKTISHILNAQKPFPSENSIFQQQSPQLTFIIFGIKNKIQILHMTNQIIKRLNEKEVTLSLDEDNLQIFRFRILSDLFAYKFYLIDYCKDRFIQKNIQKSQENQNNEQNNKNENNDNNEQFVINTSCTIQYMQKNQIQNSNQLAREFIQNSSTDPNSSGKKYNQSETCYIGNSQTYHIDSPDNIFPNPSLQSDQYIKPIKLFINYQNKQQSENKYKNNIFEKSNFNQSIENYLENLQIVQMIDEVQVSQNQNLINLFSSVQIVQRQSKSLIKEQNTSQKQASCVLKFNPIQNQHKIFSLIQDHQANNLILEVHHLKRQVNSFIKTISLNLTQNTQNYCNYLDFTQIQVNNNKQNKILLYSKQNSIKNIKSIVTEYDMEKFKFSALYQIPSQHNYSLKQVKHQFSDSSNTFYTLNQRQICLFDTRIESNKQKNIFTYKQNQIFDCFDLHRNSYGVVVGISGECLKIFDLRRSGTINKSVSKHYVKPQQITTCSNVQKFKSINKSLYKTKKKSNKLDNFPHSHFLRAINKYEIKNENNVIDISNKNQQNKNRIAHNQKNLFKQVKILYKQNQNANPEKIFAQLSTGKAYFLNCYQGEQQQQSLNNFKDCLRNQNRSFIRKINLYNSTQMVKIDSNSSKILQFNNNKLNEIQIHRQYCEQNKNQKLQNNYLKFLQFYDYLNSNEIVYQDKGQFHIISL